MSNELMRKALEMAVRQNNCDMVMTGDELRQCMKALESSATQAQAAVPAGFVEPQDLQALAESTSAGAYLRMYAKPFGEHRPTVPVFIAPPSPQPVAESVPSDSQSRHKAIKHTIIGLRDGWATRADADRALAALDAESADVLQPVARQGEAGGVTFENDPWRILFWSVAQVLHCLPSSFVDGNGHVLEQAQKAIAALKARLVAPAIEPVAGLTDAEIGRMWDEHVVPVFGKAGINPYVFARAIERHITGQVGATGESK